MTKLSKRMGPAMKAWNVAIQARISTTSGVLRHVKELKMLGTASSWMDSIQALRVMELDRSKKFRTLIAYMNMLGNKPTLLYISRQLLVLKKLLRQYTIGPRPHRHFRRRNSSSK